MQGKRKRYSADFKAKVAIEALKELDHSHFLVNDNSKE